MDEVFPDLYVGDIEDANEPERMQEHGVGRIVSLTHSDPVGGFPDSVSVGKYPMMDGPKNDLEVFKEAVEDIVSALESGESVFVHCSRGASRSVCVAGTAAAIDQEIQMGKALLDVDERREGSDPHDRVIQNAFQAYRDMEGDPFHVQQEGV